MAPIRIGSTALKLPANIAKVMAGATQVYQKAAAGGGPYALRSLGTTYCSSNNGDLLNGATLWAFQIYVTDYQELASTMGYICGDGGFGDYLNMSGSGKLEYSNSSNERVTSTIFESVVKGAGWNKITIWTDGTLVYFDVNDGAYTSQIAAAAGGTSLYIYYLLSGRPGSSLFTDGLYRDAKVWNLTGQQPADIDTLAKIEAIAPTNHFPMNEGTGNTIACAITDPAYTMTIQNTHANQWEIY